MIYINAWRAACKQSFTSIIACGTLAAMPVIASHQTPVPKQRHVVAALLFLVFLVGFITMPAYDYYGDPFASRMEARALVLHGTLSVGAAVATHFGPKGQYFVENEQTGRWYSKYGLVTGLMSAVPMAAEYVITGQLPVGSSGLRIYLQGVFYTLLAMSIAWALYDITGYYTDHIPARITYLLMAFYGSYLWYYLRNGSSESSQLLFFLLFYRAVVRFRHRPEPIIERPRGDLWAAWLNLAVMTHIRFTYLMFMPPFALFLIYLAWRAKWPRKQWIPDAMKYILLPIALTATSLAVVFDLKFGGPFLSGYHQWWDGDRPHTVWHVLHDFLLSRQWSFFINFPPLLLAFFGVRRFAAHHAQDGAILLYALIATFAMVEPLPFWRGEWAYGPRYFLFLLPLLALPALFPLERLYTHKRLLLGPLWTAIACLVFVQWQVTKMDFGLPYLIRPNFILSQSHRPARYFAKTPYAKIEWDHVQCHGHWDRLPYFDEKMRRAPPRLLSQWEARLFSEVNRSNLYWFP